MCLVYMKKILVVMLESGDIPSALIYIVISYVLQWSLIV